MVIWVSTGDATLGIMGTSGTSSIGRLLDLSLFTALFVALGAISVGVVVGNPGTLRGIGACMTGGGVGGNTGDIIPDGGLSGSGHSMRTNQSSIFDVSLGGARTGMVGGGTGPSGSSAVGATSVVTTSAGSCKGAVTCSRLRVAKLSLAAFSPTD